jgi:hypothetical protein
LTKIQKETKSKFNKTKTNLGASVSFPVGRQRPWDADNKIIGQTTNGSKFQISLASTMSGVCALRMFVRSVMLAAQAAPGGTTVLFSVE